MLTPLDALYEFGAALRARHQQYDYSGATVIGVVLLLISLVMLLGINLLQAWGKRYG